MRLINWCQKIKLLSNLRKALAPISIVECLDMFSLSVGEVSNR